MRRGKPLAALMLLLTFALGALCGMAAEEALGLDWFDFFEDRREPDGDRLLAGLSLSREQHMQAERILEDQEDALEEYWEARLPEIRRLMQGAQGELRAILTPAQQQAFDQRVERLDGRMPRELLED